jgi:hypothetical protein
MMNSADQGSSGDSSRSSFRQAWSLSSLKVESIVIILIGLLLGLVDQQASEVPGTLRFPALIAALILVGQGINQLSASGESEKKEAARESVAVGGPVPPGPAPVNRGADPDADDGSSGTGARLVLILAIWLGIASLVYPSGGLLTGLSLLAAFLLFARGWKTVNPSRD